MLERNLSICCASGLFLVSGTLAINCSCLRPNTTSWMAMMKGRLILTITQSRQLMSIGSYMRKDLQKKNWHLIFSARADMMKQWFIMSMQRNATMLGVHSQWLIVLTRSLHSCCLYVQNKELAQWLDSESKICLVTKPTLMHHSYSSNEGILCRVNIQLCEQKSKHEKFGVSTSIYFAWSVRRLTKIRKISQIDS